jgi:flagellar motor switch protein FliN
MSQLTSEIADQVIAACQANAGEVASTLGRTLGMELTLSVGEVNKFAAETVPPGPGLAVLFTFGEVGFVAVLSEASGLIPAWCRSPDATGQSKLSTLAQELSMQLVPDDLAAEKFQAARVEDLRIALQRGGVAEEAIGLSLELKAAGQAAPLQLIWPLATPDELFDRAKQSETTTAHIPSSPRPRVMSLTELPSYTRSLLKITVPVRVVLAIKKETVQDVVELAPGTIIKFSKSCEEPLLLFVGDQEVAEGEAVKVGDKFGFRVTEMTMPAEHFLQMRPSRAG